MQSSVVIEDVTEEFNHDHLDSEAEGKQSDSGREKVGIVNAVTAA